MGKLQQFFFSKARQCPAMQDERARMRMFMELHAKHMHAKRHLHHEERHMEKRERILFGFERDGDHRAVWLSKKIARKRAGLDDIKQQLALLNSQMCTLASQIENTAAYKKTLKKAEKTYKLVDWIEKNKADERIYYCAAGWTVIGIGIFGMDNAWFWAPSLSLFVSMVAARILIDAEFNLHSLKDKFDFLKALPSFAVQKGNLKKETHQIFEHA